jgi:hypothetical protein
MWVVAVLVPTLAPIPLVDRAMAGDPAIPRLTAIAAAKSRLGRDTDDVIFIGFLQAILPRWVTPLPTIGINSSVFAAAAID